jgi:hypothetical protein
VAARVVREAIFQETRVTAEQISRSIATIGMRNWLRRDEFMPSFQPS